MCRAPGILPAPVLKISSSLHIDDAGASTYHPAPSLAQPAQDGILDELVEDVLREPRDDSALRLLDAVPPEIVRRPRVVPDDVVHCVAAARRA